MLKMDQIWIETDQKRAQMDQNLLKIVFLADLGVSPPKEKRCQIVFERIPNFLDTFVCL